MGEEVLLMDEWKKWSQDGIHFWWRYCEDSWNDNKVFRTFLDYHMNFIKCRQDFKGFTLVLKNILWIKCCQTALHATEKLFLKGKASWCGKFHCCLVLRNCHNHSSLQEQPPWSVNSHQHWVRPSTSKKINSLKAHND